MGENMEKIKAVKHSKFKEKIHPLLLKVLTSKVTGELNL